MGSWVIVGGSTRGSFGSARANTGFGHIVAGQKGPRPAGIEPATVGLSRVMDGAYWGFYLPLWLQSISLQLLELL
jgi:hypothetical protein